MRATWVSGRLGVKDAAVLSALLVAAVGLPTWLAASVGAIGIPASDDWVYVHGADSLFRSGVIDMPGRTAAAVGQLVMVQPLLWVSGGAPWAFTAYGLAMTAIAVASSFLLARRFIGTESAALVALLLTVFPGFARMSTSFMTDIPCLALIMVCLLQGDRWVSGDAGRLALLTSIAAGLAAVSIREFAIAAPGAVLAASWVRSRPSERAFQVVATITFLIGLLAVIFVAALVRGRGTTEPQLAGLLLVGPLFATSAAGLLPALALGIGRRLAGLTPLQVLLGAGIASLSLVMAWGSPNGNMWMQQGFAGDLLLSGKRPDLFATSWWGLSRQLASLSLVLLVVSVLTWAQPLGQWRVSLPTAIRYVGRVGGRDGILALFLLAYAVEVLLFAPFSVSDRYALPFVPAAAILLLHGRPQAFRFGRSLAVAHGALVWLTISASLIAANSFAYDAARWREGEAAVALGYQPRSIDAGYEWVGFHGVAIARPGVPADNTAWSGTRWALINPCAVVSNTELHDAKLRLIHVNRSAYLLYLVVGPEQPLYLYGALTANCPSLELGSANRTS